MGGRRKRVHPDRLLEVQLPFPSLAEQRRIVDLIAVADEVKERSDHIAKVASQVTDALAYSLIWERDFTTVRLADVAQPKGLIGGPFGSSLVGKDYRDVGVPVIRGANLSTGTRWIGGDFAYVSEEKAENLRRNIALPGDVVFTQRGTLGQVALVPTATFDKYVISQSQMRLRVNPTLATAEYIYCVFKTPRILAEIQSRKIATANPHINLGILAALEIPLSALEHQRDIVETLFAAEDVSCAAATQGKGVDLARSALLNDLLSGGHGIPGSYDAFLETA